MNKVAVGVTRDIEAERSEFAWHPQWSWIIKEMEAFRDNCKDQAAIEEDRHLYAKGVWQGAGLLIVYIESLLQRYKKED